jgi:dihydroorotase
MILSGSTLLRNVRILDPFTSTDRVGDIWIAADQIEAIGFPLADLRADTSDTSIIDGSGWVVGPGLVDLYAHSGEPGFEQRETLASLGKAALAGGFTQVALLPTTHPVLDHAEQLIHRLGPSSGAAMPRWIPLVAFTQEAKGDRLTELAELAQLGAVGFCDDAPRPSLLLLQKLLEYLQPLAKPLLLWAWDRTLAQNGVIFEGASALQLGLKGISPAAETVALASILELIRRSPTPVHFMRISQARSVDLIAQAQAEGLPVTASTTWMHLVLTEQAIHRYTYDASLRLDPPLVSSPDQAALVEAVRAGVLRAIATDHHPYTFEEKTVPFADAPAGAIGLELALPLLWSELVSTGRLAALDLWSALSLGPARCLHLPPPHLQAGSRANLVVFDPNQAWRVDRQTLQSQSQATPWWQQSLQGRILACIS